MGQLHALRPGGRAAGVVDRCGGVLVVRPRLWFGVFGRCVVLGTDAIRGEMRQEQVRRRHQRADPFGVERAQRIDRFGHSRGPVVHAGDEMIVEVDEGGRGNGGVMGGVCGNVRATAGGLAVGRSDGQTSDGQTVGRSTVGRSDGLKTGSAGGERPGGEAN